MAANDSLYSKEEIQSELYDIYAQYHKSVKVFISQLETLQNKFPVELLNEVRAIFSHIAKIYMTNNEKSALDNIQKAKGHMRRAQIDSFKYMCYAYAKEYTDFRELYKNVDLSNVRDGEFLIELSKLRASAVEKTKIAKEIENTAEDTTDSYGPYEEAYVAYGELYKLITDNMPYFERLQQKELLDKEEREKQIAEIKQDNQALLNKIEQLTQDNEREKKKNKIVTYISIALAILSVVLGFVAL